MRDRQRAESHRATREERANEQSQSPSCLFFPTPPSLCYAADNTHSDVVQDILCYNDCCSSSNDDRNRQQIDLTQHDEDRQTVTISYNDTENYQASSEDLNEMNECHCVDENEVKDCVCDNVKDSADEDVKDYASDDVKEYACDDVMELKEYDCEESEDCAENDETEIESTECNERVNDSREYREREVTCKDVVELIKKTIEDLKRPCNMDSKKAVQKDNPT